MLRVLLPTALALIVSGISSRAQEQVENFFKATPIMMTVGFTPGAAYDISARLVANHLQKYVPGHPKIVVQNMPGAGSVVAANFLFSVARRDGSQIGAFSRGITMQPLLDSSGVRYDSTKFSWIGSPSSETGVVLAWSSHNFRSIEAVKLSEMTVAATGAGADSVIYPKLMNYILGTKFKIITGYPGNNEILLAVERGEVDGNVGTSWSTLAASKREWIDNKKIDLLVQIGPRKNASLPNVPLLVDLAPSEEGRRIIELVAGRQEAAYPIAAPPDVQADRLAALRRAFDITMTDPEFLSDAKRQGFVVDPMSGSALEQMVRNLYALSPEVISKAREAIQ
jgi:tripartite-type tricarboxylate transporter receptor subunit TctC